MEIKTILKLANNAKELCLDFNLKTKIIPIEYNQTVIKEAYDNIILTLNDNKNKVFKQ